MSNAGRKSVPPNLHLLRNNPSKKPLASLLDDVVRPPVEAPECPAHLEGEARAEWERIVPFLVSLGLVSQIDRAALAGYCDAWGEYVWACQRIKQYNEQDPTGDRGRIWDTPSGYKQISVAQQIRNRALDQCRQFLALFGMSPADRSRVTQSDPQIGLPGFGGDKPQTGGWGAYK